MATLNLILYCSLEDLQSFFIGLLSETGFVTIHQEEWQDGFWVVGANAKRASQLTATLMNLFIGYIHRNRIAIELDVSQVGDEVKATLKCNPYLDVIDMQAPDEDPVEREKCVRIANLYYERIQEKFESVSQNDGIGSL